MPDTVPSLRQEPQAVAAGDTLRWYKQLNAYSANEWTLKYVIRTKANIYKFTATNSAGVFLVELASSITATWKPGNYAIAAYVEQGTLGQSDYQQKRVRTAFPNMLVAANVAHQPQGEDVTPWAVTALAEVEKTIQALLARTVASASVNGSTYTLANINELYVMRERLRSEVRRLEEQARLNAGFGAGNRVGVRFRSLTQQTWYNGYFNPAWQ